ncbi:hypothetical protein BH09PLA1_BH09PLA1_21420 [soil metagenome]
MTLSIEPIVRSSRAERQATENLAANAACGLSVDLIELEWVYGRDGALTARDSENRWVGGCSIPRRAAMAQLRALSVSGAVACYLAPAHAAAIRVALDRLRPEQSIIAIVPDESEFRFMLHCEDFSRDVAAHRIHFVVGDDWARKLEPLFERYAGLSIPSQFIRIKGAAPDLLDSLIADAQRVFSSVTANRADEIRSLRTRQPSTGSTQRLCVVAASQRRMWNDWGAILADSLGDGKCIRIDPDDPREAAPLAVARAATECDAIVTVDVSRADAPDVVSQELPWITWVTNGNIPARSACGARDRLLVLDEQHQVDAQRAGWKPADVRIACPPWHSTLFVEPREASIDTPFIAIVADTLKLDPPANIDEFSSHRLLWELIADELTKNPLAIGDDINSYLDTRMRQLEVSDQTLSRAKFISTLIVPAYQHGLVQKLKDAEIPIRAFGNNWDCNPSRSELSRALAPAAALLHAWPDQRRMHAIDFAGRGCVRPGRSSQEMVRRCREALHRPPAIATATGPVICASMIRELMNVI